MIKAIYTKKPTAIAAMVPLGIDFLGSFRSPLIAIPAVKPVTAGKNIAKTTSIGTEFSSDTNFIDSGIYSVEPKKMDTNETMIAMNINSCVFIAIEVLIKAIIVKTSKATEPERRRPLISVAKPR